MRPEKLLSPPPRSPTGLGGFGHLVATWSAHLDQGFAHAPCEGPLAVARVGEGRGSRLPGNRASQAPVSRGFVGG